MNFRSSRRSRWSLATLPLGLAAILGSCSGGGGGGGLAAVVFEVEPNDAFADATPLPINRAGVGALADETDVDFWSVTVAANTVVAIELYGTRLDHADWDTGDSIPRVTVLDSDGTTVLLNHDYTNLWSWGKHDLDTPQVLVDTAGTYFLSVTCDGAAVTDGDYAVRVRRLNVGSIQHELEAEGTSGDNDVFGDAEPINPGTIHGFHISGDEDYFSFTVNSPSVVRFEMNAYRNGVFNAGDYYDPWLELYDIDGTSLIADQDDTFFYDSAIHFHIDVAGTYFVNVTEFGGGDAPYFLTFSRTSAGGAVESEPNDDPTTADTIAYGGSRNGTIDAAEVDGYKFSGTKGDMVRVQVFDANNSLTKADAVAVTVIGIDEITPLPTGGDDDLRTVTTILQETGSHFIVIDPVGALTDYRVELTRFQSSTYESEPNGVIADADGLGGSGRSSGVIDPAADIDLFRFTAGTNRLTTVAIYASSSPTDSDGFDNYSGHGSDLEPLVRILDDAGAPIASTTSNWTNVSGEAVTNPLPTFSVSFVQDPGGTFFVEVTDANGAGGPEFYYVIERSN